jgi:hypothetical protein
MLKIKHLANPFNYITQSICKVNQGADPGIQIFLLSD